MVEGQSEEATQSDLLLVTPILAQDRSWQR